MKELEDISLEELGLIATDESIELPQDFGDELRSSFAALELMEEEREEKAGKLSRRRIVYGLGAAASLAFIISAGIRIGSLNSTPQDTFTDPKLAYAELERAFSLISDKVEMSAGMAKSANASIIEQTQEIMTKISK